MAYGNADNEPIDKTITLNTEAVIADENTANEQTFAPGTLGICGFTHPTHPSYYQGKGSDGKHYLTIWFYVENMPAFWLSRGQYGYNHFFVNADSNGIAQSIERDGSTNYYKCTFEAFCDKDSSNNVKPLGATIGDSIGGVLLFRRIIPLNEHDVVQDGGLCGTTWTGNAQALLEAPSVFPVSSPTFSGELREYTLKDNNISWKCAPLAVTTIGESKYVDYGVNGAGSVDAADYTISGVPQQIGDQYNSSYYGYVYGGDVEIEGDYNTNLDRYPTPVYASLIGDGVAVIAKEAVRVLTIDYAIQNTKEYDGTRNVTGTNYTVSGLVEQYPCDVVLVAFYDDANYGEGKTINFFPTKTGAYADKYEFAPIAPYTNGKITKRELVVSGVTVNNKFYDGTTNATVNIGSVSNIVDGDDVTVSATGRFARAGTANSSSDETGITVTVTYILSGSKAGNYTTPASTSQTADILKFTKHVTWVAVSYKSGT